MQMIDNSTLLQHLELIEKYLDGITQILLFCVGCAAAVIVLIVLWHFLRRCI